MILFITILVISVLLLFVGVLYLLGVFTGKKKRRRKSHNYEEDDFTYFMRR
jgi:heme/copper-type cytochrome/quinol oxidase subunit 2